MNRLSFKLFLFTFLIVCAMPPARKALSGEADLLVLTPHDKAVVGGRTISLVAKLPSGLFDQLEVTLNGSKLLLPASGKAILCHNGLDLAEGINRISVVGLKGGKPLEQRTLEVFFKPVFPGNQEPDGFSRYVFHTDANEQPCSSCHSADFEDASSFPGAPQESPCFKCHKKMLGGLKFVHPPSAAWACYMCHRRKSADSGTSALEGNSQACRICHAETLTSWKRQKFRHGPTDAGLCFLCHSPHGSGFRYFLRKDTVNLCTTCHERGTLQPHIISGQGHPLQVDEKHATMNMTITCASCHSPHAGNNPRVLRGYRGSLTTFCLRCHKF